MDSICKFVIENISSTFSSFELALQQYIFSLLHPLIKLQGKFMTKFVLWNGIICSWPPTTPLIIILLLLITTIAAIIITIIDLKTWMEGRKPFHPQSYKLFSEAENFFLTAVFCFLVVMIMTNEIKLMMMLWYLIDKLKMMNWWYQMRLLWIWWVPNVYWYLSTANDISYPGGVAQHICVNLAWNAFRLKCFKSWEYFAKRVPALKTILTILSEAGTRLPWACVE